MNYIVTDKKKKKLGVLKNMGAVGSYEHKLSPLAKNSTGNASKTLAN